MPLIKKPNHIWFGFYHWWQIEKPKIVENKIIIKEFLLIKNIFFKNLWKKIFLRDSSETESARLAAAKFGKNSDTFVFVVIREFVEGTIQLVSIFFQASWDV